VPAPATDIVLRTARESDLPALVALEEATFDYDRMTAAQYRRHLASRSAVLLVAVRARELLGSALLFLRAGSRVARLYSIATAAAARGLGIGRTLLARVERTAARRGCATLRLEVRTDNATAIALYERHGYRRIASLPHYYDDGADAWRYEKSLSGTPRR
jgi:ribosomal protein S18 acetylase RimI-like enzyme